MSLTKSEIVVATKQNAMILWGVPKNREKRLFFSSRLSVSTEQLGSQ
jgi:hypothetical protein